jgi:hypothetical protein
MFIVYIVYIFVEGLDYIVIVKMIDSFFVVLFYFYKIIQFYFIVYIVYIFVKGLDYIFIVKMIDSFFVVFVLF